MGWNGRADTHGERNIVVGGEDDELDSGITDADIGEDLWIVECDSARDWVETVNLWPERQETTDAA